MIKYTEEQIIDLILKDYEGKRTFLLAPVIRGRKGHYKELFETIRKKGYLHVRVDGEIREITHGMKIDRYKIHDIEIVIDKLLVTDKDKNRLKQSLQKAMQQGNGIVMLMEKDNDNTRYFSKTLMCPYQWNIIRRTCTPQFLVQFASRRLSSLQGARYGKRN